MSKKGIIILIIIVVVIVGVVWFTQGNQASVPTNTTTTTTVTTVTNPNTPSITNGHATVSPVSDFTIHADDTKADVTVLNVPKGNTVNITFVVSADTTYHGGLDFRSPIINTGTITSGTSKTITFTAASSFVFTPYWPTTNIQKPYTISVVVSQ